MIEEKIEYYRKNGFPKVWISDNGDGTYTNPVLHSDYSDPDVIRVNDDFFMVASSFNCTPGIPLLHSKDLVNWKIVNYCLDKIPYPGYDTPQHGRGVWAPSIRYHDGYFMVFFPMPDEGIFMCRAKDPFGKWEEPICIKEARGWIDPCPFWDDDGTAYLVNGFAKSRIGFKSVLAISKMKPDGTKLLDEFRIAYDGNANHPTIEGPKMYKRNGYYYIFAPAGGVTTGWQTVLRAKHPYGPYEDKIVLHQGNTNINGPHQGALVELKNGDSWFIHFQDKGAYGRIVHLQPVKWIDDWPMIGTDINKDGIGEPVVKYTKPYIALKSDIEVPQTSDDFDDYKLGLQWQWHANYRNEWYSLSERKSHLRLYAVNYSMDKVKLGHVPNLLLQKFPADSFTVTVKAEFRPEHAGEKCGLVVMGKKYAYVALCNKAEGMVISQYTGSIRYENEDMEVDSINIGQGNVYLKLSVTNNSEIGNKAECQFSYSVNGAKFINFGQPFIASPGEWIGAKTGLFCINCDKGDSKGYADFDWFLVEETAADS